MEELIQTEEMITPEENIPAEQNVSRKKKTLWPILICAAAIVLAAAFFLTMNLRKYSHAAQIYEQGDYLQAADLYAELGNYRDAAKREADARYVWAGKLAAQKDYEGAIAVYDALGDHKESVKRARECYYALGDQAIDAKEWDLAAEYFAKATDDFRDAKQRRIYALYQKGHELFLRGDHEEAQTYFDRLEGQWPQNGGPHFVTFEEALEYIQTQALDLPEIVTVVVANMPGSYILRPDILNATVQQRLGYQFATVGYMENTRTLTVKPSYYPGQRIVQAWRTDDFSKLTENELETYRKAQSLIAQAREIDPDPEAVELWIHDWICQNVEYDSPFEYVYPEDFVGLDELTCVGAILNGKANCQGYTDAFYLMGTLAGLEVYVMFGVAGGGHCWNGVRLDGKTYLVDTTFDDTFFEESEYWSYIWYNNVLDLDEYSVDGGSILFPGLVTRKDLSKTYYARTENVYEGINYAAFALLREYRKNGPGVYHAVIEEPDRTEEEFHQALINNMSLAGVYSIRYGSALYTYEGDTYIWVCWQ